MMRNRSIVNRISGLFLFIVALPILFIGLTTVSATPPDSGNRYIAVCEDVLNANGCARLLQQHGAVVIKQLPLINGAAIVLPPNIDPATITHIAGILRVDPDTIHFAVGETITWNIQKMRADQVWNITSGNGVKVGILDTGIDSSHPDLKANILGGFDTINYNSWNDNNGHGTHVAGIVAAIRNNGIGVAGVAPDAGLYAVRVLNTAGFGKTSDIIEGIDWCISKGCRVINMSFGSYKYNKSFQDAINRAYGAGIVPVAAAGNDGTNSPLYPAAYNHVLAVSATDRNDNVPSWSNYGSYIDFAAPGASIYSTYKKGTYATMSGTSMASPHVAGIAALRISQYITAGITYTPDKIEADIANTAYKPVGYSYYYYGNGIPDALNLSNLPLSP